MRANAASHFDTRVNGRIVGDFDGDGRDDFASTREQRVWFGESAGTFSTIAFASAHITGRWLSERTNGVQVGDFNGDGRTDVVSAGGKFVTWLGEKR